MLRVLLVAVSAIALLAGCSSTPDAPKVSDKDAARYNVQLGMSYMQRGDLEGAREKLERAVKQDPTLPEGQAAMGILYERVGDRQRAEEHLQRATRLAPEDPNMLNTYGSFLCRNGKHAEGTAYFESSARNAYNRRPEVALTNAGVCARNIPNLDAAEAYFRRALDVNRGYNEALLQLADLSIEIGRPLQARAFLQRYEATGPVTAYSLALGWRIESADGNRQAANEYAHRLRSEFPDSREARNLGGE